MTNVKTHSHSKGNILIVDDVKMNQKFLSIIVNALGYNSFNAKDGNEAIEFSKHQKYDLIFMDWEMPILNGFEATTAIRRDNNVNKNTPIILQTTANAIGKAISYAYNTFTDAIDKPYNTKQVKDTIIKYARNPSEAAALMV